MYKILPVVLINIIFLAGCSIKPVYKKKDIVFNADHNLKLDIYSPKKIKEPANVLVFIHGGSWQRGEKSTYHFFGKGMARKGIVTVVIDYRLHPATTFSGMATDAAEAVKWTKENITSYGGDSSKIFITGHSAGGHLAALIATDNFYFKNLHIKNPVKGVIINDAFGLDMYAYLSKYGFKYDSAYAHIFTRDPEQWKKASPIYHLKDSLPPILLYLGGKTYPGIIEYTQTYYQALKKFQPEAKLITVKRRRHVGMMGQFYFSTCKRYKEILSFIETNN